MRRAQATMTGPSGSHSTNMPLRHTSTSMSEDAVPSGDPQDTTELLAQRLTAWRYAVEYLQNYVEAAEKFEKINAKEREKMLKTISSPLKQGTHFDSRVGGIAGLFENMRSNTQGLVNSHIETEKNIKGSIQPILDRLGKEIKNKIKDLSSGATKSAKAVDKARLDTQKHIELLGQHSASYESAGGKRNAVEDPYVLHRQVQHRLHKQVSEENNNRHELIAVQNNFSSFEGHIIEVIQQVLTTFNQFVHAHAQKEQAIYADMLGCAQQIRPNFEWDGFVQRNGNMLIDATAPDRSVGAINFPNQDHHSAKPLIAGTLERKSRNKLSLSGHTTHYYVVTPSKFLHEFSDKDDMRKDPVPDMSIYLPDATIGATSGEKFNVKGKDVSKGLTSKLSGTSEVAFKAHSAADAQKWFDVIRSTAGSSPTEPYTSAPPSPIESKHADHQFAGATTAIGDNHPASMQSHGVAPTAGHGGAVHQTAGHGAIPPAQAHAVQGNVHAVDHAAPHGAL